MIKRAVLLYFLLIAALHSQQLFTSSEYKFEIIFPAYMTVSNADSRAVVAANVDEKTSFNIVAATDTSAMKIEDYDEAAFVDELRKSLMNLPGFVMVSSGRKVVNGNKTIYVDYAYDKSGEKMRAVQYLLKNGSRMFAITTVSTDSEFSTNEVIFGSILNTFRFIE